MIGAGPAVRGRPKTNQGKTKLHHGGDEKQGGYTLPPLQGNIGSVTLVHLMLGCKWPRRNNLDLMLPYIGQLLVKSQVLDVDWKNNVYTE